MHSSCASVKDIHEVAALAGEHSSASRPSLEGASFKLDDADSFHREVAASGSLDCPCMAFEPPFAQNLAGESPSDF